MFLVFTIGFVFIFGFSFVALPFLRLVAFVFRLIYSRTLFVFVPCCSHAFFSCLVCSHTLLCCSHALLLHLVALCLVVLPLVALLLGLVTLCLALAPYYVAFVPCCFLLFRLVVFCYCAFVACTCCPTIVALPSCILIPCCPPFSGTSLAPTPPPPLLFHCLVALHC